MKKPVFPQKTCREGVLTESGLGYSCELQLFHLGPCATFSSASSVRRRDAWEAEHPDQADATQDVTDVILPSNIPTDEQ